MDRLARLLAESDAISCLPPESASSAEVKARLKIISKKMEILNARLGPDGVDAAKELLNHTTYLSTFLDAVEIDGYAELKKAVIDSLASANSRGMQSVDVSGEIFPPFLVLRRIWSMLLVSSDPPLFVSYICIHIIC